MKRRAQNTMRGFAFAAALLGSTGCAYTIPGSAESLASLVFSLGSGLTISADIAVSNAREGGRTQSGFLTGTASADNLAAVEIAVGEGAYTEATGTDTWSWQIPTGPAGLRLGTTYTLNIRARDARGNYSNPTSFTIKKGLNRDVNGDGYPDLLVSAPAAPGDGRAYIFHGGSSGPGTRNASAADTIIIAEGGGYMASRVELADINGDGFADAVVSDPGYTSQTGRTYIFYSRGSTGIASAGAASADAIITGHTTGRIFGASPTAGDLNSDGYTDLAVGSVLGTGAVYLFLSAGNPGIATQVNTSASAIMSDTSTNTQFGASMALGDINGDGFADLLVSAPSAATFFGRAYVFLSSGGALTSRDITSADTSITGETSSRLCADCLIEDLNDDGYGDIILGSDQYSSSTGRVYVFYSAGANGIASGSATSAPLIITGASGTNFGRSTAVGDIDGDGNPDLVAGSPGYPDPNDNGRAFVFYNVNSLTSGTAATLAGTFLTGAIPGQSQTGRVALLDLNGDGYDDVLTGSRNTSAIVDEIHYFRAPGSGMITSQDLGSGGAADAIIDGETVNDRFAQGIVR